MTPELTAVTPQASWAMPDAIVALDWSGDARLLGVAADGTVAIDGGPPSDGHRGHGAAVAGCWVGASCSALGYRDGTVVLCGDAGSRAVAGAGGPLAALLWTGSQLVAAHRAELVLVGPGPPLPPLDVGAGRLRAFAALTPSYLVAVGADDAVFVDVGLHLVETRLRLVGGISVAADPHGRYVAIGDLAGSVHVLGVGSVDDGRELTGYPDPVRQLACVREPAGVVAAADDELTFWSVDGGRPCDQPACAVGHDEPITLIGVSPTAPLVATADAGGRLCLWSLRDLGGPVWQADRPGEVTAVAWSQDGGRLAVGDVAGTVETWAVTPGTIA